MDPSSLYAVYVLVQTTTGITLYQTTATQSEILQANQRLKARGLDARFYAQGTYKTPCLHGQPSYSG